MRRESGFRKAENWVGEEEPVRHKDDESERQELALPQPDQHQKHPERHEEEDAVMHHLIGEPIHLGPGSEAEADDGDDHEVSGEQDEVSPLLHAGVQPFGAVVGSTGYLTWPKTSLLRLRGIARNTSNSTSQLI